MFLRKFSINKQFKLFKDKFWEYHFGWMQQFDLLPSAHVMLFEKKQWPPHINSPIVFTLACDNGSTKCILDGFRRTHGDCKHLFFGPKKIFI
jgi:hypothetical protein